MVAALCIRGRNFFMGQIHKLVDKTEDKSQKKGIFATMTTTNPSSSKKAQIGKMFDNIAPTYDRLNHILSMNIDHLWRRRAVKEVCRLQPRHILDVATGTGDLAIALARKLPCCPIMAIDLSEKMLAIAEQKVEARNLGGQILLAQGDVDNLDFEDESFDMVTVGFGVRNFTDLDRALGEMRRTIREGGHIVILELSNPRGKLFAGIYRWYSHKVLPFVGKLLSRQPAAYKYLPASVDQFPTPERFVERLKQAGFRNCTVQRLSFGIARLYIAQR